MNINVMKQALRALQYNSCYIDPVMAMDAITALKDAIKEAEEIRSVPLSLVNDAAKAAAEAIGNDFVPGFWTDDMDKRAAEHIVKALHNVVT